VISLAQIAARRASSSTLWLGHLEFHLTIFFPVNLSSGIPFIQNVERFLSWLPAVSLVRSVGIAPVSDARKEKKDKAEPEEPTPAKIPVVRITMSHFDSPSDKSNKFFGKADGVSRPNAYLMMSCSGPPFGRASYARGRTEASRACAAPCDAVSLARYRGLSNFTSSVQ
jgi:hypothetical protein